MFVGIVVVAVGWLLSVVCWVVVIAVVRCLGLTVFGMRLIWIVVVLVMLNMLF